MKKTRFLILAILLCVLSGICISCSDNDGESAGMETGKNTTTSDADGKTTTETTGENKENTESEKNDEKTDFISIGNSITFSSDMELSEITDKILNLTEDTTIILKGAINAVSLKQIALALKTNDSPKISIDMSETTGISTMKSDYFSGITNLYSINLPETVVSISESAFDKCTGLVSVQIDRKSTRLNSSH